jgi:hypothetical protein
MSKVRSTIAVCVMSLFAAVALFPSVASVESAKAGKAQARSTYVGNAVTLIADGGAPQPPIPPPSGFEFAS